MNANWPGIKRTPNSGASLAQTRAYVSCEHGMLICSIARHEPERGGYAPLAPRNSFSEGSPRGERDGVKGNPSSNHDYQEVKRRRRMRFFPGRSCNCR
jgi:hypothetical protein